MRANGDPLRDLVKHAAALVFDFDGTLVDSNPIKLRAFERCFADFPKRREAILAYCGGAHRPTRSEKFRHVYERLLGLAYTAEIEAELHRRFDEATTRQIIAAPEIPGASRFLTAVRRGRMTALLSTTPEECLRRIVAGRGWQQYFTIVQGAPVDKGAWLRMFRTAHDLEDHQAVFFGDAEEDAEAAAAAQWVFVAVGHEKLRAKVDYVVADFEVFLPLQ